jgi:hypothetical protein
MNGVRGVAAVQGGVGALLAARPDVAVARCGIRSPNTPPAWVVRLLGGRMVLQAGAELLRPTPDLALTGALVDATHALSMVGVALISRRYRRGAVISAGIAAASAVALTAMHES